MFKKVETNGFLLHTHTKTVTHLGLNESFFLLHLRYDLHVETGGAGLLGQRSSRGQQLLGLLWPDEVLLLQADGGVAVRTPG